MEGVVEVKGVIKQNSYVIFRYKPILRPDLDMIEFKNLYVEEKEGLEEMFTREQIREVIFGCEGDRSPGPDGFNMEFIKKVLGGG